MMTFDAKLTQQLLDALQIAAPLAQRMAITARQQHEDSMKLLNALERAIAHLRQLQPGE